MHQIEITKDWIHDFVIALELCPFAKKDFVQDKIKYSICLSPAENKQMEYLIGLIKQILEVSPDEISNAFLIIPNGLSSFEKLLDFHYTTELLLQEFNLADLIQIVPFHPENQFGDAPQNGPENWINRSPFPMIHILRVDDVASAVEKYPGIEELPEINRQKMRKIGIEKLEQLLAEYISRA